MSAVGSASPILASLSAGRIDLVEEIRTGLDGDHVAVMLYGSCARGDDNASSDIDVLQLVQTWRPSYSTGRISVSVYSTEHLLALARAGSLFVLHLVTEGKSIEDPHGRLSQILASYRQPASYERVEFNVRRAASVLDVDESTFLFNPGGFVRVALYLLRTMLYVRCAAMGTPTFSIARVAQCTHQPWIADVFGRRGCATFAYFEEVRSTLLRELDVDGRNEFETLEALAVALYERCPIATCLALKLLAGSDRIDYDSTFLDWSHDV